MTESDRPAGEQREKGMLRRLTGPEVLAFLPAISLAGFWVLGESGLIAVTVVMPLILGVLRIVDSRRPMRLVADPQTGLPDRDGLLATAAAKARAPEARPDQWAALAVEIDDWASISARLGEEAAERLARTCVQRIRSSLRAEDLVARIAPARFDVLIAGNARCDLESMIHLATRLQRQMTEPETGGPRPVFATLSVGFCTAQRRPSDDIAGLVLAAEAALEDTLKAGSGGIRAFTADMQRQLRLRTRLADELPDAIASGRVAAWFQPQIALGSGALSGLEVLARWQHPELGIVPPSDFLPLAEDLGLLPTLGSAMMEQALFALQGWDAEGLGVPGVSINFTGPELADPGVVERIGWELDRFGIAPERLTVEVLETVIAGAGDDIIARNLRGLTGMGCRVDLDDFGTGHASITTVRRFSVSRLKIDRSFVSELDRIAERADVVSAVLTMTDQLGLDCLAEGIERPEELAALQRMGCGHAQGYLIGRPMPAGDIPDWVANLEAGSDIIPSRTARDEIPRILQGKTA